MKSRLLTSFFITIFYIFIATILFVYNPGFSIHLPKTISTIAYIFILLILSFIIGIGHYEIMINKYPYFKKKSIKLLSLILPIYFLIWANCTYFFIHQYGPLNKGKYNFFNEYALITTYSCMTIAAIGIFLFNNKFNKITKNNSSPLSSVVLLWGFMGIASITLSKVDYAPWLYLLLLIFLPALNDAFGYLIGSKIGKKKLAPKISPNKTYEGAVYGSLISLIILVILYSIVIIFKRDFLYAILPVYTNSIFLNIFLFILVIVIISFWGIVGDLFFSKVKRDLGIKDFSNLLSGHGGICDRIDSILFVSILVFFIMSITLNK